MSGTLGSTVISEGRDSVVLGSANVALPDRFMLAESPVWSQQQNSLYWVDITENRVHRGLLDASRKSVEVVQIWTLDEPVGAVQPASKGGMVLGVGASIAHIDKSGQTQVIGSLEPSLQRTNRRFNDASVDPAGRLLIGTLAEGPSRFEERLFRVEPDGQLSTLDDDLGLANGIAWSCDGSIMYSVDSIRRTVFRRRYTENSHREVHLMFSDGMPDGISIDSEDCLWVAVWGAGEVRRFAPDGVLLERVAVPAPHTSSVAFAGSDLRTLIVTTAREGLTKQDLERWPLSGSLFMYESSVAGRPSTAWREVTPKKEMR